MSRRARPVLLAGAMWLLVYLGFVLAGQRFDTRFAHDGYQVAPYELLSTEPLVTSWHVHVQPPLWNLVIGTVARWSPFPDGVSFQVLIALIGMSVTMLATTLALVVRVAPRLAVVAGLVVGLWPATLANAFALSYELPVACLLLALVVVVVHANGRWTPRWLAAALALATAVVLVRSIYHPVWLGLVLAGLWVLARRHVPGRTMAVVLAVPVVVIGALVVKNVGLIGEPTLTSWSGMNLLRSVQLAMPQSELDRMIRSGDVSPVAGVVPFSPYSTYRPLMPACDASDAPTLLRLAYSRELRRSPFTRQLVLVPNFNYECYVPVYEAAGRDARAIITAHPDRWLHARVASLRAWFTDYPSSSAPVERWSAIGEAMALPVATLDTDDWNSGFYADLVNQPLAVLPILTAVALAGWLATALRRVHRTRAPTEHDVLAFAVAFVYAWTLGVSVLFELGEQARFRTGVDPVLHAGLAVALAHGARRRARQRARVATGRSRTLV